MRAVREERALYSKECRRGGKGKRSRGSRGDGCPPFGCCAMRKGRRLVRVPHTVTILATCLLVYGCG